ncbi:MAG: hypothetical protein K2P81_05720 [Bacteriovoracaceae bacterium]|nr:hypothetical protein [Bacteriovoracaceae bacterium]
MRLLTAVATALVLLTPELSPVLVENMNLDYRDGKGQADAVRAKFEVDGQSYDFQNATFDVRQDAGELVIERPLDNFTYRIEAAFLNDVNAANAQGVWFDYAPGHVIAKATSAKLEKGNDITNIGRLSLNCKASARNIHPVDSCIFAGKFTLSSFGTEGVQRSVSVSEADVNIVKGKTTFSVKIGGIGKINGTGTTSHDSANSTVVIKVDKVKLGILDITGQFFSQIENNQSDSFKVKKPYIYVKYSKSFE